MVGKLSTSQVASNESNFSAQEAEMLAASKVIGFVPTRDAQKARAREWQEIDDRALEAIRRLGKDGQQVIALDKALAMLTDEAVPPDVRRLRQAA